jgi:pimeloyl-ACP methyl ester carboxylesterase
MHTLTVLAALLGAGAVVTLVGVRLIERLHPPRGRFLHIAGFRQHIIELGEDIGKQGHALPVVLLHGAGCNLEDMRLALGERLAAIHRVILIDRPGQGWSERPEHQGSSPTYQAAVLGQVLDRLGVDRAIIVGHSWGGALALSFALDYPRRAAGLVVVAPPTHPRMRRTRWFYVAIGTPFVGWLVTRTLTLPVGVLLLGPLLLSAFLPQRPPARYIRRAAALLLLRPRAMLANARDISHIKRFLARQVGRYAKLAVPLIILSGNRDNVVLPQHHSKLLAAAVPSAKLELLPGRGHMLHHSDADQVIAAIETLVGRT